VPPDFFAEQAQLRQVVLDRRDVISGHLAILAGKHRLTVGNEDLHLARIARIEENLSRLRPRGGVFRADADPEIAKRYPERLTTPARLDELSP
jgi:hypothetical protein